jgi:uncharacterized protein YjiS (DUF1127 family)
MMRTLSLTDAGERRKSRSMVAALFSRIIRALERRRAVHDLMQLDDHMLSDIGVTRADIHRAVDGIRY